MRNAIKMKNYGCKLGVMKRMELKVWKWFRYVRRMGEEIMVWDTFWWIINSEGKQRKMKR